MMTARGLIEDIYCIIEQHPELSLDSEVILAGQKGFDIDRIYYNHAEKDSPYWGDVIVID